MDNMKWMFLLLSLGYFQTINSSIISTFYPVRLQRQGNEKTDTEEYLLDVNNKYLHLVVEPNEHMNVPFRYSVDGKPKQLYNHNYKCFKKGYVKNTLDSNVFINDCEGLNGIISYDNNSLFIKPAEEENEINKKLTGSTLRLENMKHVLTTFGDDENEEPHKCTVGEDEFDIPLTEKQIDYHNPHDSFDPTQRNKTRLLEFSIIVPVEYYNHCNKNLDTVFRAVTRTIYFSNALFNSFNLIPLIMFMEIYTNENPYGPMAESVIIHPGNALGQVKKYRMGVLRDKNESHDLTFMIGDQNYKSVIGVAFVGTICHQDSSIAYARVFKDRIEHDVIIFVHEVGHVFGFGHSHRRNPRCHCRTNCLMDGYSNGLHYSRNSWADCEYKDMLRIIKTRCLNEISKNVPFDPRYCGNGIVDIGEQCDCGFPSDCAKTPSIRCCDPVTCRFINRTNCVSGACCSRNCWIIRQNSTCKAESNECFSGLCDGKTTGCIAREIRPVGYKCSNNDVCAFGICQKYNSVCKEVFGTEIASKECFHIFNKRGNISGNCGVKDLKNNIFVKCQTPQDELCGKIICKFNGVNPSNPKYLYESYNDQCAVFYNNDKEDNKLSMVPDGIWCGKNKICVNNKCTDLDKSKKILLSKSCGHNAKMDQSSKCSCKEGYYLGQNLLCYIPKRAHYLNFAVFLPYLIIEIAFLIPFLYVVVHFFKNKNYFNSRIFTL